MATTAQLTEMQNLKKEIDNELEQISITLEQVSKHCETEPEEDDTILRTLNETSALLKKRWSICTTVYQSMSETLGNIIGELFTGVVGTVTKIEEINNEK